MWICIIQTVDEASSQEGTLSTVLYYEHNRENLEDSVLLLVFSGGGTISLLKQFVKVCIVVESAFTGKFI